jgi:hypothetical protein
VRVGWALGQARFPFVKNICRSSASAFLLRKNPKPRKIFFSFSEKKFGRATSKNVEKIFLFWN